MPKKKLCSPRFFDLTERHRLFVREVQPGYFFRGRQKGDRLGFGKTLAFRRVNAMGKGFELHRRFLIYESSSLFVSFCGVNRVALWH